MKATLRLRPKNEEGYQPPFKVKKNLSLKPLIEGINQKFHAVPDKRQAHKCSYELHDVMMGALSCMFYQEPSWLNFQQSLQERFHQNNLFTMFNMKSLPRKASYETLWMK